MQNCPRLPDTDPFCFPPCKTCTGESACPLQVKASAPIAFTRRPQDSGREWAPNRLPEVLLPCGCKDIPWPILYVFAENITRYHCDRHGPVQWKGKGVDALKKKVKKAKKNNLQGELDICPF